MVRWGVLVVAVSLSACETKRAPELIDAGAMPDAGRPCDSNPCAGLANAVCVVEGHQTRCVCADGFMEVAGSCVLRTACNPNPCTEPHRTTCVEATCRCDDDFVLEGARCIPAPSGCRTHGGDSAEPDECAPLAKDLSVDVDAARTLSPAGDQDWFRIAVTPLRIFRFSTTRSLSIDVFTPAGSRLAGDDSSVEFTAPPATTELLVRVRGWLATDVGSYQARVQDVGLDDFVNEATAAMQLAASDDSFSGTLQYERDVDVVTLLLPATLATELSSDGGTTHFTLTFSDGGTQVLDDQPLSFTPRRTEVVTVSAKARRTGLEGTFTLAITPRSNDDHSDSARFANTLAPGEEATGRIEYVNDIDTFVLAPVRHHIYRAVLTGTSESFSVISGSSTVVSTGLPWKSTDTVPVQLRVRGPVAQPGYTVRIDDLGLDVHGDEIHESTYLPLASPLSATLEHGADVDFFRIDVPAGRVMRATVTSVDDRAVVTVFDRSGNQQSATATSVRFMFPAFDSYYLRVSTVAGHAVNYALELRDLGPDDHGGVTGPTPLTVGATVTGALQYEADVDALSLQLVGGRVYRARCSSTPTTACRVMVTGSGVLEDGVAQVVFFAPTTGTYLVKLELETGAPIPLAWTFEVMDQGLDDHGNTAANGTPITLNASAGGRLDWAGDTDAFLLPVIGGQIYEIELGGPTGFVDLLQPNGNFIVPLGAHFAFRAPVTETLAILVRPGSAQLGDFVLVARQAAADDHGDTLAAATALLLPADAVAKIQFVGDVDVFSFQVTPRAYYAVTSTCPHTVSSTSGDVLQSDVVAGGTVFQAPANVTAVELRFGGISEIPCDVSVRETGFDDHADTSVGATPLRFDAGVSGFFATTRDTDVFVVDLVQSAHAVGIHFENAGAGVMANVRLTSPSGVVTVALGDVGFLANETGRWTVAARSNGVGVPYTVRLSTAVDDVGDTLATASALSLGTAHDAWLQYTADVDVFTISLSADTFYRVGLASPMQVEIHDANGVVDEVYANGARIYIPAAGTYEVRVRGRDPRVWSQANYHLRID